MRSTRSSRTATSRSTVDDLDVFVGTTNSDAQKIQDMAQRKYDHLKLLAKERIKTHFDTATNMRTMTNADQDRIAAEKEAGDWWDKAHQKLTDLNPRESLCDALRVIHLDEVYDAMADVDRVEQAKRDLEIYQDIADTDRKRLKDIPDKIKEIVQELESRNKKSRERLNRHFEEDYLDRLSDAD